MATKTIGSIVTSKEDETKKYIKISQYHGQLYFKDHDTGKSIPVKRLMLAKRHPDSPKFVLGNVYLVVEDDE